MRNLEQPARAAQALPLLVGTLHQIRVDLSTFLLTVQHSKAAAVFAFIGLGAGAVFAVSDNVFALALLANTMFNDHGLLFTQKYAISYKFPLPCPQYLLPISVTFYCIQYYLPSDILGCIFLKKFFYLINIHPL